MAYDEKTAERVREILSGRREVIEKKLMGGLSFMVNGKMCCSVSGRGGLLIRVGEEAREKILKEPHVEPMEMAGRTMSGFVRVTPEGYRTEAALRNWIQRSLDFVATLPQDSSATKASRRARVKT